MDALTILGLEWHRWLFFLFAWVPWLLIELWYFRRMKNRFGKENSPDAEDGEGDDRDGV